KVEKSKDVPNLFFGDPNRLMQILINLVGNAIKFTEKGSVSIRVEPGDLTISKHKMIRFTIEDTGIGIEPDRLDKIFWAFEQAYSDTLRKYGGTGLGLAISKELVELQGGQISVFSKKGKGSKFSFELPMEIDETMREESEKPVTKDNNDISRKLQGTSILLVEDNEFNIMVAKEELEDVIPDVKVIVAKNGKEAIEILEKSKIEIILMDLQMPVINGFEATTTIRNLNSEKAKVPIIAMTANVMKEEVEKCLNLGMNDYISKPFETKDLLMKIGQLTRNG
ncbi:MAG: response regulator, partial [Bacteroidales bacterium]|nr:response regulator [Bacteroidales bacterium]